MPMIRHDVENTRFLVIYSKLLLFWKNKKNPSFSPSWACV